MGRVRQPEQVEDPGPTVDEVIAAYWQHIEQDGRYIKNGEPTSERGWLKDSLRPLSALFGASPAGEFGPKKLHALRAWVIDASREKSRSLSRSTLNGRIRRVVRVFRWAVSMELVPALEKLGENVTSTFDPEASVPLSGMEVLPLKSG